MKLNIILTEKEYDKLTKDGVLHREEPHEYSLEADTWMRSQMAKRFVGHGVLWPFYAHTEKIDLRQWRSLYYPDRGDYYRVVLDIPEDRLLIHNSSGYSTMLNGQYLSLSMEEDEAWDAGMCEKYGVKSVFNLPANYLKENEEAIHASWERIFTPELFDTDWLGDRIDAAVEEIRSSDVVSATRFTGSKHAKFYGPKRLKRGELPPLRGCGDELQIGDSFKYVETSGKESEDTYVLDGYVKEGPLYHVWATTSTMERSEFAVGNGQRWGFVQRGVILVAGAG